MSFDSLLFPAFLLFALIAFNLSRGSAAQPFVQLGLNLFFIGSFSNGIVELLPLAVFLLLGFVTLRVAERQPGAAVTFTSVAAILLVFCILKQYPFTVFLPSLQIPYLVLGLSYILFRVLQLIVDCLQGAVKERVSVLEYLNFTTHFLCFVSGPVQRYQDHRREVSKSAEMVPQDDAIQAALTRILTGYVKLLLLSAVFIHLHHTYNLDYVTTKLSVSPFVLFGWYTFSAVTYGLHLYLNFSGYMDIVIGAGGLFGMTLPENFDRPFQSKNFLEFWSRWHMTVSNWFRFYMFNPLVKVLTRWLGKPGNAPYIGVFAYFVTFFVVGYWHVPSIWLGIFLGAGISLNKLYQIQMRAVMGKKRYKKLCSNQVYSRLCQGMTFSYFCISITFLWMDMVTMRQVLEARLVVTLLLAFMVIGLIAAAIFGSVGAALEVFSRRDRGFVGMWQRLPLQRDLWLGAKLFFVIFLALATINPAPEFIYRGF